MIHAWEAGSVNLRQRSLHRDPVKQAQQLSKSFETASRTADHDDVSVHDHRSEK
jgi:hypothetical protein